ncbi:MAG: hypothetical protein HYT49_02635 [Candidatus Wildermuthbacteria bacterium]|nr:hypothetical protein [Candidatus Wildermuthbacteria bacterium]
MELTTEMLERFVGGQAEIQNERRGYLSRGEVKTIVVEDGRIRIKFVWRAKGEGFPPVPKRWVKEDPLDYTTGLMLFSVSEISAGSKGGRRVRLSSAVSGEMIVLFPKNGDKLDPAEVVGLELP